LANAPDLEDCGIFNPGCGIENLAKGQIYDFVRSIADGTISTLKALTTFWMELPSPDVSSNAIVTIQQNLSWYTFALAVIGLLIALGRMVLSQEFNTGKSAIKMIVNLTIVTAAYAAAFTALIMAGDAFAPWIVEKATGQKLNLDSILSVNLILGTGIGPGFLLAVIAFIAGLANVAFMVVRTVMIGILFAFIPTLAAASASEMGEQAFRKAQGYLLAFVLFKPVAGVIYALGFLAITDPPDLQGLDEIGKSLFSTVLGVVTLLMASLALPALIKFIVPVAANGTSGAFSGGSAVGAIVAAGGAVVAVGAAVATGGSSAAATGAAATGGTAAASTGTAAEGAELAATVPPTGGDGGVGGGGQNPLSDGDSSSSGGSNLTNGDSGGGSGGGGDSGSSDGGSSSTPSGDTSRVMNALSAAQGGGGSGRADDGIDEAAEEN
jgi:type IV secretion system protein TrbL